MDGETLIHVFRRLYPAVRIIACSGLEVVENVARATKAGVNDFLAKPFTADSLLRRVREVIDRPASEVAGSVASADLPESSPA